MITEVRMVSRAADLPVTGLNADSSRAEAGTEAADLPETEETASRDRADPVRKVTRAKDAGPVQGRGAIADLTVHPGITEPEDRVPDSEIRVRARALREMLPQRIWKRGVKKTRDVPAVRRRISVPERITSMKRKRH